MIDFQAAPGGANGDCHSGTGVGVAGLWGDKFNLDLAAGCLVHVAEQVGSCVEFEGVVGLQICNQASCDAEGMYEWYEDVVGRISRINAALPVYVSDGWDLEKTLKWSVGVNPFPGSKACPVVVDTHRYYTFEEIYRKLSPVEIIERVERELHEIDGHVSGNVHDNKGAMAVYVGEYSCAMPLEVCRDLPGEECDQFTSQFGMAQSSRWQEKANGCAFWTLKMENKVDPVWNFKDQVEHGAISPPKYSVLSVGEVKSKLAEADQKRSRLMTLSMDKHVSYFAKIGGLYEHWRYADGWHLGFTDARAFFAFKLERSAFEPYDSSKNGVIIGADRIGAIDLWVLKRMKEEDAISKDKCEFVWELEHGIRAGIKDFNAVVGL